MMWLCFVLKLFVSFLRRMRPKSLKNTENDLDMASWLHVDAGENNRNAE